MDLYTKLDILDQIYEIYNKFINEIETACKKFCSTCCTRNVIMTSLEGYKIADFLLKNNKSELFNRIKNDSNKKRFQPKITTNKIADLCIHGKELPFEEIDSSWGSCPLLMDNECPIYNLRPFSCRCMVSKTNCIDKADMDPFVLTVNNVFLQYIEHIDQQGFSGNLTDVLLFMESENNRKNYNSELLKNSGKKLIINMPMSILLVPPEHEQQIRPIISSLQKIKIRRNN